ncbi:MAG: DUF177 domain-containing protein [Pseudomonadota bacterium]
MSADTVVSLARLPADLSHHFTWAPERDDLERLAADLGILEVRKARAEIELRPQAKRDWMLIARWGATVVQSCGATLAPVVTRLDDEDRLTFSEDAPDITENEAEMPENDALEPLVAEIDLGEILREFISLALPAYPRAPDAALETRVFGPPGQAPMTDEDARPFAGLAELKEKLTKGGS